MLGLLNPTGLVASSGYVAIFLLSIAQSCCVPTSSELTLGFAGVLAAEHRLGLPEVIAAGVVGELIGAYIAWIIGRSGGRAFVDRYGRYLLLSHRDLDRAEAWYDRHGGWGVFGSRCFPVIRNFVALPAGVAEVPPLRFGVLTFLGSLVWDSAMALIGYGVGSDYRKIMHGVSDAGYILGALLVVAVVLFVAHRWRSYRSATADQPSGRHRSGRSPAVPAGLEFAGVGEPGDPNSDSPADRGPHPTGLAAGLTRPRRPDGSPADPRMGEVGRRSQTGRSNVRIVRPPEPRPAAVDSGAHLPEPPRGSSDSSLPEI